MKLKLSGILICFLLLTLCKSYGQNKPNIDHLVIVSDDWSNNETISAVTPKGLCESARYLNRKTTVVPIDDPVVIKLVSDAIDTLAEFSTQNIYLSVKMVCLIYRSNYPVVDTLSFDLADVVKYNDRYFSLDIGLLSALCDELPRSFQPRIRNYIDEIIQERKRNR